jgi:exodeoxyribonuclease VII large subunit
LIDANRLRINTLREQMTALDRVRETLGYRATLARGYAVVRGDGDVVTTRADAESKGITEIEFVDGRLRLSGARRSRSSEAPKPEQGSLF